jgi:type IV secretion system protein VirB10
MNDAASADQTSNSVMPVVRTSGSSNVGLYIFLVILAIGGAILYSALIAADEAAEAPSIIAPQRTLDTRISSPPPLATPYRFAERADLPRPRESVRPAPPVTARPTTPAPLEQVPRAAPPPLPEPPVPEPAPAGPQVVFEAAPRASLPEVDPTDTRAGQARVNASRLRNPSETIPQGTVIPAVLETALNSTQAGGVRALVQRDVYSFDGTRVLIHRGSRLYGEYGAGLQRGQKRALVQWTRLVRPDGVTIALDSPSSDPLGRAGIEGKVDTKFFQRFGGAILQSVLDIGVGLAVNQATDGVIVALPGSTQNVRIAEPDTIQPTLKVKHGTSVSVFVARDLDFSSVET